MNEGVFYRIAVKKQARTLVLKNLIKCCGIALIYLVINFSLTLLQVPIEDQLSTSGDLPYATDIFLTLLPALMTFVELLILSPVSIGFFEFCMRLCDGKPVSVGDLFLWFGEGKRYWKALLIYFEFTAVTLLISLAALLLPGAAFFYCIQAGYDSLLYLVVPVMLVITVFLCAMLLTYFPGMFILAENPERKPWSCLKESRKLFKHRKWDFFFLNLSFFGWFFLVVMFGSVASEMVFVNYGFISSTIDLTNIPVAVRASATVATFVGSGLLLLYVMPYFFTSMAYYIKGVQNPNLFHISVPGWRDYKNQNPDHNPFGRRDGNDDSGVSPGEGSPSGDQGRDNQDQGNRGD